MCELAVTIHFMNYNSEVHKIPSQFGLCNKIKPRKPLSSMELFNPSSIVCKSVYNCTVAIKLNID